MFLHAFRFAGGAASKTLESRAFVLRGCASTARNRPRAELRHVAFARNNTECQRGQQNQS
eukprot:11206660-Lingulodinium_polyedra.AAC.1